MSMGYIYKFFDSPFPILFLTSPCLFCTYHLCFLFPVPFLPLSPFALPTYKPPCDLHFCDSVPILVVCLVCFLFLGSVVDSCECCHFTVHILIIIFFLDKSLYISYNKGLVMTNSFNYLIWEAFYLPFHPK